VTTLFERVYLDGYITERRARKVIAELHEIHRAARRAPIEFIINSQGGSLMDGTAIYSALHAMSEQGGGTHQITTQVRGMCGSIATVVFQAGDIRQGGALDTLVFHESMISVEGEYVSMVAQRLADMQRWEEEFLDILMLRATAPREVIASLTGPLDRTILMKEAVALGLADKVA
jgi:ATP-dependent protease ClpP protease subunit